MARVSLNMLRARRGKPEQPLETWVPDPIVSLRDGPDPEQEALIADSVGRITCMAGIENSRRK